MVISAPYEIVNVEAAEDFLYFLPELYAGHVANLVSYTPCEHKVSGSIPRPTQTWDACGLEPHASNGKTISVVPLNHSTTRTVSGNRKFKPLADVGPSFRV